MRRIRPLLAVGGSLFLLLFTGCSEKLARQTGLTDSDLFSRGEKMVQRGKHGEAAEAFQVLLERFPSSPLAARAQFGLAVSRMANREEAEAESAFDDFLRLYPADPNVPDALFRKGMLLARQALPPGRDQGKTRAAIQSFTHFLQKAPGSARAAEASETIRGLRDRLARHEAIVVNHYLSRKLYDSAEVRARRAVDAYRDVPSAPILAALLAESLKRQGRMDPASDATVPAAKNTPRPGEESR